MDSASSMFLAYTVFNITCVALGYTARVRGWLREETSRSIHFHTVVWLWSTAALLSLWKLPLRIQGAWLLIVSPAQIIAGALVMVMIGRLLKWPRKQTGALVLGGGLANQGFTMGAYLCYLLLDRGDEALAYGMGLVTVMMVAAVPLLYPMARHYGGTTKQDQSLAGLIYHSFVDLRAMPLYAAVTGVTLALLQVPPPQFLWDIHVIDVLFFAGGFGAYFGVGMLLFVRSSFSYRQAHLAMTGVRFALIPAVTIGLLWLMRRLTGGPDDLLYNVLIIESFTPAALLMVMLSNLFHLDARLASNAWLINTLLFVMLPLPVLLWWFG